MKKVVLAVAMFALAAMCLFSAFSPKGSRKIMNSPKAVLILMAVIFLLCGLLALWAEFMTPYVQ